MIKPKDSIGRKIAAELLREIRRDMPFAEITKKAQWTRRDWYRSCRATAYHCAENIACFRKANEEKVFESLNYPTKRGGYA